MYKIIATCIERATASITRVMCEYKAREGVPCSSLEGKAFSRSHKPEL